MRKRCFGILIAFLSLAGSGAVARAQTQCSLILKVDHPFVVVDKTLPAGTYTIKRANEAEPRVLLFRNSDHGASAIVLPYWRHRPYSLQATVTFEQIDGQYFLSKIDTNEIGFTIPLSRAKALQLAKLPSELAPVASGRD